MKRHAPVILAILALAGCSPSVPDSGAGVGFGDYNSYVRNAAKREAQLTGQAQAQALPPAGVISPETVQRPAPLATTAAAASAPYSGAPAASAEASIAAETRAALAASAQSSCAAPVAASATNPPPPLATASNVPPPVATNANGISRENNFDAVGELRSIDDDAERMARNRAQYQVIQPTALPQRTGEAGPNLVQFALSTTNQRGEALYTRRGFGLEAKARRACAKYPSPDLAQSDFLAKGGPQRDRLGLDPDGDGFACSWNPAPFRQARGG